MKFKKINFSGEEEIFETIVKGREGILGKWRVMKKDFPKVVGILNDKFGLGMIIKKKSREGLGWTGV